MGNSPERFSPELDAFDPKSKLQPAHHASGAATLFEIGPSPANSLVSRAVLERCHRQRVCRLQELANSFQRRAGSRTPYLLLSRPALAMLEAAAARTTCRIKTLSLTHCRIRRVRRAPSLVAYQSVYWELCRGDKRDLGLLDSSTPATIRKHAYERPAAAMKACACRETRVAEL